MKNILFVMSNQATMKNNMSAGCYIPELTYPIQVISQAGIHIDYASPKGGKPAFSGTDYVDPFLTKMMNDTQLMNKLNNSIPIDEIDADKYDAIFYTGGHGGMYDFVGNTTLNTIAETIYANGGIVSALCHGPAGLIDLKKPNGEYLVKDKKLTCFTKEEEVVFDLLDHIPYVLEDKLIANGAIYINNGVNQGGVEISERLITGQNLNSSHLIGKVIAEKLGQ